jgi:hypothetical protein
LFGDNEELGGQTSYAKEIAEQEMPARGLAQSALGNINYIRAEKWRINRVFYFLSFVSVACLAAIIISPYVPVEITVVGIWTSAVALSRYLLRAAYNGAAPKETH